MAIAITTLDQLQTEAGKDGGLNAFVSLAGGFARSSKLISYSPDNDSWYVLHEIDETESEHASTEAMLAGEPTIAEALERGALYAHWLSD